MGSVQQHGQIHYRPYVLIAVIAAGMRHDRSGPFFFFNVLIRVICLPVGHWCHETRSIVVPYVVPTRFLVFVSVVASATSDDRCLTYMRIYMLTYFFVSKK